MNIVRDDINESNIFLDEIDLKAIVEALSMDNSCIFYLKRNTKIIGAINKNDLKKDLNISLNKPYIYFFDHIPYSSEINNIFSNNPLLIRISVFVNSVPYCEYRKVDYPFLPKTVAKNILALKYIPFFKKNFNNQLLNNGVHRIGIIGEQKIVSYLVNLFAEFYFEKTEIDFIDKYDLVFDFRYGKFLRKLLNISNKVIDLSDFIMPIAIDCFKSWMNENKIKPILIYDSVFEGMDCLSKEEIEIRDKRINFTELLNNRIFLEKFCMCGKDYFFIENKLFNQSHPFYSDTTIKQTDVISSYFTIKNGIRYSGVFPLNYTTEIHLFGPCSILGMCGPDDYTISYQLQNMLNKSNGLCKVFNHGVMIGDNLLNSLVQCLDTKIKEGDAIVLYFTEKFAINLFGSNKVVWLKDIMNKAKTNDEIMFFDVPGHCNRKANKIIATYISNFLSNQKSIINEKRISFFEKNAFVIDKFENLDLNNPDIYSSFLRLASLKNKLKKYKSIGTITMYASPFTKGHEFLIKKALEQVDALVVFLVTENFHSLNSIDRFEMVKRNTKKYCNVFVVPSENYFASKQYFPEYSSKVLDKKLNDLVVYQEYVSSKYLYQYLNIKYRFVGEENIDKVTKEYNQIISECCKNNGIKLIVIPRLTIDGIEVSGSLSRKAMNTMNESLMKKLLPFDTIKYFKEEMLDDNLNE